MKSSARSNWRTVKLGEVCVQDREIIEARSTAAQKLSYLSLEHIFSGSGEIIKDESIAVEDEGRSSTFAFDNRHVLYGKLRPYLNKVALPDFAGRCTTELIPLLPKPETDREFLAWILRRQETVAFAMQGKTGSRMPRADMDVLMKMEVPLVPPDEQRRIAARLREQMAEVERARAAVQAQLDAAKTLPAALLRAIFTSPAAQRWPKHRLGDATEISSGITLGRKLNGRPTRSVPYLRVANVKDGRLDLTHVKEVEATENEIRDCQLLPGDVLLTEGGDPDKLGRGTFWRGEIANCIHQNHIFRVRSDAARFEPAFLAFQFGSSYGKAYFFTHGKQTTGIASINKTVLSNFPLMVPPLAEQQKIAARLDAELTAARSLVDTLETRLAEIELLPATLLRSAFSQQN